MTYNKASLAHLLLSSLVLLLVGTTSVQAQENTSSPFDHFNGYDPDSNVRVDYSVWSRILDSMVYDVGFSDREPAPRSIRQPTGTRIQSISRSRYRLEGNRIIYHLLDEERKNEISLYRQELISMANQISLDSLNRDEQLAFWLNLYSVIVIDEITQIYPTRNINRPRVNSDRSLFNRHVATIDGMEISLNNIRYDIVEKNWENPLVIYGFFSGAIGGPTILPTAYDSSNVWGQLHRIGREYVNSLRGIDDTFDNIRISSIYFEHEKLFPTWSQDLRRHLNDLAFSDVRAIIPSDLNDVSRVNYDWNIADLTNGSICNNGAIAVSQLYTTTARDVDRVEGPCSALPIQARELVREIEIRRLEHLGSNRGRVFVRDLPSPDPAEVDETDAGTGDTSDESAELPQ